MITNLYIAPRMPLRNRGTVGLHEDDVKKPRTHLKTSSANPRSRDVEISNFERTGPLSRRLTFLVYDQRFLSQLARQRRRGESRCGSTKSGRDWVHGRGNESERHVVLDTQYTGSTRVLTWVHGRGNESERKLQVATKRE